MLCEYWISPQGLPSSPQKLVTSKPLAVRVYATGCCIHASVTMMKNPDSHDPRNTANPAHQCPQRLNRSSPYKNNPRDADSRKNENTPSITSGWPITPPVT